MTNMTETDSDITRDDRDEIVITKGYESYNEKLQEYNEKLQERKKEGVEQQVQIDQEQDEEKEVWQQEDNQQD